MFYDDNGIRDMFIYGSLAMLAALAMPAKKAHAAEVYLCGDGRMVEVTNGSRQTTASADSCVTSWYQEREKVTLSKSGQSATQVATAMAQTKAYQIQTAAIEPLVNAIEVPERSPTAKPTALREKFAGERRVAPRMPTRQGRTQREARHFSGLRHVGDGIYAN